MRLGLDHVIDRPIALRRNRHSQGTLRKSIGQWPLRFYDTAVTTPLGRPVTDLLMATTRYSNFWPRSWPLTSACVEQ